jgi:tetratricopeptide (TPR) repeat protein
VLKALGFNDNVPDDKVKITLLFNAAQSNFILGKYDEAATMHRQVLTLRTKVLGAEHPDTLTSMNNLALVLDSQGNYDEAVAMHRQAFGGYQKVLGAEHPDTLASINNLAHALDRQGNYDEAAAMHR